MQQSLIQQGDVLIFTNSELPGDATPVKPKNGQLVLAEGEATGHAHTVNLMEFPGVELFQSGTSKFLRCAAPVEIVHQEHHKVKLPKGCHKIGIVQEVDPFTQEIHSVKD